MQPLPSRRAYTTRSVSGPARFRNVFVMLDSHRFKKNALECDHLAVGCLLPADRASFAAMASEWRVKEQTALAAECRLRGAIF